LEETLAREPKEVRKEMGQLNYGKQYIDDTDIRVATEVLSGDWLTQGPYVEKFENALAEYCGAKHAVAVSNGTIGLYLAVKVCNTYGHKGITSPITFVASANTFEYNRMSVDFADIDKGTWNIDNSYLENKIDEKTRVIIPVHFAGLPCKMRGIKKIADDNDLFVIEDACHALGATYHDKKIGSCEYSDMTIFSFHPVKHITTCEGGAILTNNDGLAEKLRLFRNHGITKQNLKYDDSPWYYEMHELGINARITDLQCAIGLTQLQKLDWFLERRKSIAEQYREALGSLYGVKLQNWNHKAEHAYHLFVIKLDYRLYDRKCVYMKLKEVGINCQVHYVPVHTQPFYRNRYGFHSGLFPNAEDYYSGCLSLPIYPAMSDEDTQRVIESTRSVLSECRRKS
jgi:UDP-4-amino-4,6-dideoxy-N-acetyl-beta-L-altrosamine transaminase